jgi:opacity protein-like surface antigen
VEPVEPVKSLAHQFVVWPLCAASSILFAASICAQESNPETLGDWFSSGEYVVEETYVGSGDVERNAQKGVRDFDEHDSVLHLVFTPRIKPGVLRLGLEWERFSFGIPDGAPLPDTLQAVNLVIGLDTQLSDSILIRVEALPGVYNTGFDDLSDDFNAPFVAGGSYIFSPNLQLVLGVSVDIERKYPVLPAAGVRWKMAPQWVLNAVLPTPRLEFEMNNSLTLYAGANLKQANYRVDDHFGDNRGIARLNHAVITYTEVRVGAGVDWKISPVVTLSGEVGYQPYREFDFYRAHVRYHQDNGAPYGMISLHGAF